MRIDANSWYFSPDHGQLCQVIETQTLWGETTCRVWLPGRDSVVRVPASRLASLDDSGAGTADGIAYVASAARVADALTQGLSACGDAQAGVLLAPIESSVIPLPHQIKALSRAISGERVRYLLADEVGLGKTIEAGLILRELKLRGLVKRVLVITPKGLLTQWVAEMRTHFNEDFRLLIPSDFSAYRRIAKEDNIWQSHPQVVCPMDSVKPLESRRGWSAKQVADYNQERFEDLVSAGWDLVIVDEAHRLGGSTDQVARFKLGQGLCEAAPYFLMLSATPHQGKTDAFHRLVSLLDAQDFPDVGSVTRDRVQPYVIRTEKRHAITAEGKPLFKPRKTELAPVSWGETHRDQQLLYEAVTEYVREGYNPSHAREAQLHRISDDPDAASGGVNLHWGMVMAVYPFWSGVAIQTGRLLRLQGSAAAAHVQHRVREQYGERETVSRAVRRMLRSYLDWGVLQETGIKGVYTAGLTLSIDDPRLIAWLAEASLHARANGTAPLKDLIDSPSLFPFRIQPIQSESIRVVSPRLDILRHGLDENIVTLVHKKQ